MQVAPRSVVTAVRSPRFLRLALLSSVFMVANCDCDLGTVEALPEPHIDVIDEADNKFSEATLDDWMVVNFGDVDQGVPATHELNIFNSNTGVLEIANVCLVAANSAADAIDEEAPCIRGGEAPFTFPNIIGEESKSDDGVTTENIALPITFVTQEGGAYSYFLRIESNDANNPFIAIQLTATGTAGRLCADNAILDFGSVAVGTTSDPMPITLTNCGVKPVTVDTYAMLQNPDDAFTVTLDGATPVAPFTTLEADDSIVLNVTFTPAQVQAYRDTFAGTIQLTTEAPFEATYTLLLVGDGVTPPSCRVNVVPGTVQFGAVAATETATQDLIIQSVGECACTVESIVGPTPGDVGFSIPNAPALPIVLAGSRGCDGDPAEAADAENLLRVTLAYTAPDVQEATGANATLDVTTTDNNEPTRTVNLEATGGGTPYCELDVTPIGGGILGGLVPTQGRWGTVEFGRTSIFFEKRLPIEFKNIGNADCHISNIQWAEAANTLQNEFGLENEDGSPVSMGATNITIAPNSTHRFMALFAPTHTIESSNPFDIFSFGSYSASNSSCGLLGPNTRCNGVTFTTDDTITDVSESGLPPGEFSLGFSATPVKPQIDVIPGELDFGLVTVGCGSPQVRVTVYNTGSGDLVIGNPLIDPDNTPPDFEITATGNTSPFPYTIPPGGSMPINVRYRANALGVVTGQVEPSLAPLRRAESDGGPASAPPPPARPRRSQTVGAVDPRRGHPSAQYAPSPTETPQPQQPPSASPPPPPAPSPPAPSPPASAGRPSPAPTPISSPASMVPVPEHTVADTPVDMPEHIDEDLRNSGKSEFVIAGIQRRRDAAAAREAVRVVQGGAPCGCCVRIWSSTWSSTCGHSQANALPLLQARIKAISDREAKAQEEERNRHDAQQELGAKLDAWRLGSNGQMNDIRVLLCNLDSVLWEGARWKPVKMGELIDTKKVHLKYKRACAVVHPDKNMNAPFMQRYTAERIFEALNEAHKSV